jgi:hypothetical protein
VIWSAQFKIHRYKTSLSGNSLDKKRLSWWCLLPVLEDTDGLDAVNFDSESLLLREIVMMIQA